jgi:hypothetical protein
MEDLAARRSWAKANNPYWSTHVATWLRGHQTAQEYCRRHKLSIVTFEQWARHLLSPEDLRKHAKDLQKLRMTSSPTPISMTCSRAWSMDIRSSGSMSCCPGIGDRQKLSRPEACAAPGRLRSRVEVTSASQPCSLLRFATTRPSDARASTPPYDTIEFWCAVQSSALIDGTKWLPVCSWNTVAAHLSMGVTEQPHWQSNAISRTNPSARRRQDSVRSVVLDLHQSSCAVAQLRCSPC